MCVRLSNISSCGYPVGACPKPRSSVGRQGFTRMLANAKLKVCECNLNFSSEYRQAIAQYYSRAARRRISRLHRPELRILYQAFSFSRSSRSSSNEMEMKCITTVVVAFVLSSLVLGNGVVAVVDPTPGIGTTDLTAVSGVNTKAGGFFSMTQLVKPDGALTNLQ